MVYDKKRSGDPDYDDKQPPAEHGRVVNIGDGTTAIYSEATGLTTPDGEHFALGAADPEDHPLDNRPAPGEVATETSEVTTYGPSSAPVQEMSEAEYRAELSDGNGGVPGGAPAVAEAETPTSAKKAAATTGPKK